MSLAEETLAAHAAKGLDHMIFRTGWFITRDEHRADGHFPLPDFQYCADVLEEYVNYKLIILTKSRQMLITWITAAYLVACALINKNELSIYQTKREEDAQSFMERVHFLYNHLPEYLRKIRPKQPPQKENKMKLELITQESRVWGIPSGGDVVRMQTITRFVSDECNFQPEAKASLRAMAPALGEAGQAIYISTACAGGIQIGLIAGEW
jgi:hypothetical protein